MHALVVLDRFAYSLGHIYRVQFWSDASDYLLYHSALLLLMVKLWSLWEGLFLLMGLLPPSNILKLRIERRATYSIVSDCSGGKEDLQRLTISHEE